MKTDVRPDDAKIATIERLAASAFANHEVTSLLSSGLYRHWRCAKPGDSAYAFNVTTIPGRLIVTGDIGCLILERTDDMIAWSRGSINSMSYFAEKVPHEMPTSEYDPDVVERWVKDTIETAREWGVSAKACEALRAIDDFTMKPHVEQAIFDSGAVDGSDWPTLTNWTSSFLWCREAIKFLLSKLPASPESSPTPN